MINNPLQTYGNTQIMTAPPGELVLMLYNGAIRFLKQANSDIKDKKLDEAHSYLLKAQNILIELMSTLDMEYPVAKDLRALYDYMNRHLIEANIKKNVQNVQEVIELLEDLRNTWNQILKMPHQPPVE